MKIVGNPSDPREETRRRLVKELSVFFVGIGALLCGLGVLAYQRLDATNPPLLGMPRRLAVGIPLLVLGVWHVLSGVLLILRRSPAIACVGAIGTTALCLTYFAFLAITVGIRPNILMLLVVTMPVLAWQRTSALVKLTGDSG